MPFVEFPALKLKRSQGGEMGRQPLERPGFANVRFDGRGLAKGGDLAFRKLTAGVQCKLRHQGSGH